MIQPTNTQNPYPQQGGANAVSINIYNPQAYGSTPNNNMAQAPYNYTNSFYNVPQASAYAPMAMQPQPYMAPQQFVQPYFQQPAIAQPIEMAQPQLLAPAPQAMPESVITPNIQNTNEVVNIVPQAAPEVAAQTANEVAQQPVEIVNQAPQAAQAVNTDELVQGLKSADANMRAETINKIAAYAQETPEIALQIVSEPIMQSLVDIIKEDTTALAGPTPEQIAVAEKITKGEQLTPEENALAEQLSPRDMANKNRIFALYTLAMIQKLQRDELNQYIEAQKANGEQTIAPLRAEDLIGYNEMVNIIKNDTRPEVKLAAIQAIQHIAEPQDQASIQAALAEALNSPDEAIKTAAAEAMAKFAVAA